MVVKFLPSSLESDKPLMNKSRALIGSSFQAFANSLEDTPAAFANLPSSLPDSPTAPSIFLSTIVIAVPPASASIPKDDIVADNATICASVIPTWLPCAANRIAMDMISDSVVAIVLPSPTTELPNLSKSSCDIPTILANLANSELACSRERLVDSPKSIMVLVKLRIESFSIPNCPAASATPAISDAEAGSSFAISRIPFESLAYPSSDSSTVLRTPAKADS